jgi:hypothetical protein
MSEGSTAGESGFYCPSCDKHVDQDLLVFLSHTDQHVIDALKKQFPGWVESDGTCPK